MRPQALLHQPSCMGLQCAMNDWIRPSVSEKRAFVQMLAESWVLRGSQ